MSWYHKDHIRLVQVLKLTAMQVIPRQAQDLRQYRHVMYVPLGIMAMEVGSEMERAIRVALYVHRITRVAEALRQAHAMPATAVLTAA